MPKIYIYRIAIFSGEIPSTTFIEHLVNGVSRQYEVYLFGVIKKKHTYSSKSIKIFKTPNSFFKNFLISFFRTLRLLVSRPKDLIILISELKSYSGLYNYWIWYTKFLPIVLYKPEVFHMQWARDLEFYMFLKTKFNIPIVVSLRGAHINYTPIVNVSIAELYRKTFPFVDRFHAVSNAIAQEALKYGDIQRKTTIIHSPIPSCFFNVFEPYKKRNDKLIKIVSIGRFHWKKGYRYALDSLKYLKLAGFDFHYTIVGSYQAPEELLFQIQQLNLIDNITIVGYLNQNDLISLLHSQDVLLLSSVEEGIANVVLEAMAIGIPVVSTNCGGMSEVVFHKKTGWLVPKRNSKAIAQAIIEVSQTSESELQRITQHAHDFVKLHFNTEQSIKQFLELYEGIVNVD